MHTTILLFKIFEALASVFIIIFKMEYIIYNVDQIRELVIQIREDKQKEHVNSVCNIYNILITLNHIIKCSIKN